MAGVNKAILVGNVGADPELRYTAAGEAVANFSLATSKTWKDKAGEKQERTEWHRCVAFSRRAEVIGEHVRKGASLYVEGEIRTEKYEKDGDTRYSTKIYVDAFQFVGRRSDGDDAPRTGGGMSPEEDAARARARRDAAGGPPQSDFDDDIPF